MKMLSILVWTEDLNVSRCMCFQTKTHCCGQGLKARVDGVNCFFLECVFLVCFREQVFIKTMFPLCGLRGDSRRGAWVQMWGMPAWVLRRWNQM